LSDVCGFFMECLAASSIRFLTTLYLCCTWGLAVGADRGYEAALPAQLATDPDLCAYVPCKDVLPGADRFSRRMGKPAYVEAYRSTKGKRELIGYVFLSTDIVDIPAYSGKPVVSLIGMDTRGIITGVRILRHSESIMLLGVPQSDLAKFVFQYVGKFVGDKITVGKGGPQHGVLGVDAISGATVTVIALNQSILRSGLGVARQVGIVKPTKRPQAKFADVAGVLDWQALLKEGSVQQLRVTAGEVGLGHADRPYIDIYFGYLNVPAVGRSVLGDAGYAALMARLKPGDHAIFMIADGMASFKGSGFVRGGIYERVQVVQDIDAFTFRDVDYLNLYGIEAAGAPRYRESAIFIIRSPLFSAAYPWRLVFLANKMDAQTGSRTFVSFDREYWLPGRYLVGGRPKIAQRSSATGAVRASKQGVGTGRVN
jgi:NosR/NirI family nitrous oxide reductase transcriptional regulator